MLKKYKKKNKESQPKKMLVFFKPKKSYWIFRAPKTKTSRFSKPQIEKSKQFEQ